MRKCDAGNKAAGNIMVRVITHSIIQGAELCLFLSFDFYLFFISFYSYFNHPGFFFLLFYGKSIIRLSFVFIDRVSWPNFEPMTAVCFLSPFLNFNSMIDVLAFFLSNLTFYLYVINSSIFIDRVLRPKFDTS